VVSIHRQVISYIEDTLGTAFLMISLYASLSIAPLLKKGFSVALTWSATAAIRSRSSCT